MTNKIANELNCEFQMWWNRFEGVKDESN